MLAWPAASRGALRKENATQGPMQHTASPGSPCLKISFHEIILYR